MAASVVVLGGGPAGLGAALGLARRGHPVTLLEQQAAVGGNAGSFELAGMRVDYGSHRLHPASDPAVLSLVRELLGDDLLTRPRHGRIRLLGRWIHFPLRPLDLALRLHPRFALGVATDLSARTLAFSKGKPQAEDTFASVLERGLGRTICREFYFPFSRKVWGLEPDRISPSQAYRRVSAGSIGKLVRRLIPGLAGPGGRHPKGVFYYPRRGFGQISDRLCEAAVAAGADVRLGASVRRLEMHDAQSAAITFVENGMERAIAADHVWSTIPLTRLAGLASPAPPAHVLESASRLQFRAMVLVYLVLAVDRFSEFDAHYFPEEAVPFTRISEPKNYSATTQPAGVTVLCAEIPCARGGAVWSMSDADLGALVRDGLARVGLPVPCPVVHVVVRRLAAAYPIYARGYERDFDALDEWIDGLARVLSFGRQGLYTHDNTHHALFMAQAAVDCLCDGAVDRTRWHKYRLVFERHVVED